MSVITYQNEHDKKEAVSPKDMLSSKAKRMTFEMDRDLHATLKAASAREGVYIRDILTEATKDWLKARGYK